MCLSTEQIEAYRKYLERLAKEKSKDIFSNGGKDHAITLYSVLMQNTNTEVRIFCECAESEIWQNRIFRDSLINGLKDFNRLRIITRNGAQPDLKWIPESLSKKIECKKASESALKLIADHFRSDRCNFSVFDETMFRFEYDIENFKAYGSFNEPEIAESMVNLFDRCWAEQ